VIKDQKSSFRSNLYARQRHRKCNGFLFERQEEKSKVVNRKQQYPEILQLITKVKIETKETIELR